MNDRIPTSEELKSMEMRVLLKTAISSVSSLAASLAFAASTYQGILEKAMFKEMPEEDQKRFKDALVLELKSKLLPQIQEFMKIMGLSKITSEGSFLDPTNEFEMAEEAEFTVVDDQGRNLKLVSAHQEPIV